MKTKGTIKTKGEHYFALFEGVCRYCGVNRSRKDKACLPKANRFSEPSPEVEQFKKDKKIIDRAFKRAMRTPEVCKLKHSHNFMCQEDPKKYKEAYNQYLHLPTPANTSWEDELSNILSISPVKKRRILPQVKAFIAELLAKEKANLIEEIKFKTL